MRCAQCHQTKRRGGERAARDDDPARAEACAKARRGEASNESTDAAGGYRETQPERT
jgi:hypothetical protein